MMNPSLLVFRSQVVQAIRVFFDARGFLEMHTPRLIGLPGQEPYLEPFWTEVKEAQGKTHAAGLITSPEYAMKRLLAAGFEKIYDLGPCFRNEEPWDGSHDPEFLMVEWYRRGADLSQLMDETEEMVRTVAKRVPRQDSLVSSNFDALLKPFRRMTVTEAIKEYASVDLEPLLDDRGALAEVVKAHGQTVLPEDTWDDLFFKVFLSEVEPHLGWNRERTVWQPTFLYRYPLCMASLAKRDPTDPRYASRAELYIGDLELSNGFAELTDPLEQRKRFEEERALRANLGKKTWNLDERFLEALPAMGEAAGNAFGVDRLVMLLAGAASINDVLPFPARERFY